MPRKVFQSVQPLSRGFGCWDFFSSVSGFNHFLEYLFIGALYLIPYFAIHYTVACFKHNQKMGFRASLVIAYKKLPDFLKGNISLQMNNPRIVVVLFIFLLILVGTITNGMLDNTDRFWLKASSKIMPGLYANIYEANADTAQYVNNIKAIFKYDRKACDELIGKIRYQKIITRHGIAHSIILLMCLPFIFACKKLTLGAKFIWMAIFFFAVFQAINGFLATNGWYDGVLKTILLME
jgi:hypothetical protein